MQSRAAASAARGMPRAPHHVDEADAVLLQRVHVARQVALRKDAAVHARVQRLHAPCMRTSTAVLAGSAERQCSCSSRML